MIERTAAIINGRGKVTTTTDQLELKPQHVLIRVHASLISPGTEMALVRRLRETPNPDFQETTFGYANAGEVVDIDGDGKGLRKGMRVAAMGAGAAQHATYTSVPVNLVVPLPDEVSYEQGAYACLAATAMQGVRRTSPELGEYGLVLGLGIVGNLAAQLYQLSGSRVLGWEALESRLETARQCGVRQTVSILAEDPVAVAQAFAAPYGIDFAMLAFGGEATAALHQVKRCLKVSADGHAMGRIILIGGCTVQLAGGVAMGNLDIRATSRTGPGYHDAAYEQGADYPNAFVPFTTQRNLREIVCMMAEKRLCVEPMTTHRLPLAEVGQAADLLVDSPDQAQGVLLQMSH